MKTAIIVGSSGQDGLLLSRYLKSKGYYVIGFSRKAAGEWCDEFESLDVRDPARLIQAVRTRMPNEFYYRAAHHRSSRGNNTEDREVTDALAVNLNAYLSVLETAAHHARGMRIFYACSSLIFGELAGIPLNENTVATPTCLYGISKLAARQVSEHFRNTDSLHVSVGVLFNHESIYRNDAFLSKTIINGVKAVKNGGLPKLIVGDLEAQCDWGYAGDFVEAMWRMLQLDWGDTYVVATGTLHTVRDWVDSSCKMAGLNPEEVVKQERCLLTRIRPPLLGDSTKLREATGWVPRIGFSEMVRRIYEDEV